MLRQAPTWHADVQVFRVRDTASGQLLGFFYLGTDMLIIDNTFFLLDEFIRGLFVCFVVVVVVVVFFLFVFLYSSAPSASNSNLFFYDCIFVCALGR